MRIFTSVCQVDCIALMVNYAGVFDIGNVCVGTYCLSGRTGREIICPKSCLLFVLYFMYFGRRTIHMIKMFYVEVDFVIH